MRMLSVLLFGLVILLNSVAAKQPNIVFILTDDQRWDCFGCYGRPEFKTKTIDKLASEGVIFDNAIHAVAICKPSRATIMTGRYFASHQCGFTYPHDKIIPAVDFADSYHAKLKQAGYRSGFIGKFGFPVENVADTLKLHFDYLDAKGHQTKHDDSPGRWAEDMSRLKNIYYQGRDPKERTIMKGDSMINFLDTQPKDKPFILSVSFDAVKNDRDSQMYGPDTEIFKDATMSVPKNWYEGPNPNLPDVVKQYARGVRLHKGRTATPAGYQNTARRFATQGVTVDNQMARLLEKLTAMNVLDNTIIIYTSDNGRFHGSQGIFDKGILYEEAVKAPLIIWDGRKKRGRRESSLVSTADLAPTILAMANIEAPQKMQGVDLTELIEDNVDREQWRNAVFMENLFIAELHQARVKGVEDLNGVNEDLVANNRSYRSRGVRTERFKYFRYYEHDPVVEELYDLENDPHELNNLASNPEYASTLSKLRKQTEQLNQKYTSLK